MTEPRWLTRDIVVALHEESIALYGGASGIRDDGLLESALARPRQLHAYEPSADLAAAYGAGIVQNHPFVDGNKRDGLLAVAVFLRINDAPFDPDEVEEVQVMRGLAAGDLDEAQLAAWVRKQPGR